MIFDVSYKDRPKFLASVLWNCLGSEDNLPLLAHAGKDDLSLFREQTCLFDLREEGLKPLYIGKKLRQYTGFETLQYDSELSMDGLSEDAVDMQRMIDGLFLTFEMAAPHHKHPWLCLPFAEKDAQGCAFILCVHGDDGHEGGELALRDWLDAARIRCRHMAGARAEAHEQLYDVLAAVYAAGKGAGAHPEDYQALLREAGLRAQARAPFTPLLKIVFGRGHDKTRLAEYSAALSWLARNGIAPRDAAATFRSFPGGIKGCVQEERRTRRQKSRGRRKLQSLLRLAEQDKDGAANARFALLQADGAGRTPRIRYEIGPDNPKFTNLCEAFEKALEHERPD